MHALLEPIREADVENTPFAAAVDSVLGSIVDGLVEVERSANRLAAWRVEQIYELSRFTELNTGVTTSQGMRAWSQRATARRTAISEVALALRIPERSAEALIEESRMLVERLPRTMAGLRQRTRRPVPRHSRLRPARPRVQRRVVGEGRSSATALQPNTGCRSSPG